MGCCSGNFSLKLCTSLHGGIVHFCTNDTRLILNMLKQGIFGSETSTCICGLLKLTSPTSLHSFFALNKSVTSTISSLEKALQGIITSIYVYNFLLPSSVPSLSGSAEEHIRLSHRWGSCCIDHVIPLMMGLNVDREVCNLSNELLIPTSQRNELTTSLQSMPLLTDHVVWKYSNIRCLRLCGRWWTRMKSLRSLVLVWYWDQREYILWIMAVTLPKTNACISAAGESQTGKR